MSRRADTYKEIRTFEYPGVTVRVHIPDISDEERARRTRQLVKAAEGLMKAYQRKDLLN